MPPNPPDSLAVAARKRRRIWTSPQEMSESLTGRGAFNPLAQRSRRKLRPLRTQPHRPTRRVGTRLRPRGRSLVLRVRPHSRSLAGNGEGRAANPHPPRRRHARTRLPHRPERRRRLPQRLRRGRRGFRPLHPHAPPRRRRRNHDHRRQGLLSRLLSRKAGLNPRLALADIGRERV